MTLPSRCKRRDLQLIAMLKDAPAIFKLGTACMVSRIIPDLLGLPLFTHALVVPTSDPEEQKRFDKQVEQVPCEW